jgi:hypothetical protein
MAFLLLKAPDEFPATVHAYEKSPTLGLLSNS